MLDKMVLIKIYPLKNVASQDITQLEIKVNPEIFSLILKAQQSADKALRFNNLILQFTSQNSYRLLIKFKKSPMSKMLVKNAPKLMSKILNNLSSCLIHYRSLTESTMLHSLFVDRMNSSLRELIKAIKVMSRS